MSDLQELALIQGMMNQNTGLERLAQLAQIQSSMQQQEQASRMLPLQMDRAAFDMQFMADQLAQRQAIAEQENELARYQIEQENLRQTETLANQRELANMQNKTAMAGVDVNRLLANQQGLLNKSSAALQSAQAAQIMKFLEHTFGVNQADMMGLSQNALDWLMGIAESASTGENQLPATLIAPQPTPAQIEAFNQSFNNQPQ